ncbi:hypothetical protein AVEN_168485-1, partial [Araneus ventricosus]
VILPNVMRTTDLLPLRHTPESRDKDLRFAVWVGDANYRPNERQVKQMSAILLT